MKIWRYSRFVIYLVIAVLLIVFRVELLDYLKYLIGALMVVYGLQTIVFHLIKRKTFFKANDFFWGCTEIFLGIILLTTTMSFEIVCAIWAIWSILRETNEIENAVIDMKDGVKVLPIIDILESVVMITFSVMLLISRSEEHVIVHIILLSIELIVASGLPLAEDLFAYIKKRQNKENVEEKAAD